MMKLHKSVLPACGVAASVIALLLAGAPTGQAGPSDKDVHVINATFDPVPTSAQGITNVAGTVSVTNTPNVHVANTTPIPVSFTSQPLAPFQTAASTTESGTNVSTLTVTTVPAGKRLVIEWVSMIGQVPAGQHVELMDLTVSNGPGGVSHQFVIQSQPDAVIGDALFRANQSLKLYADAGTQVSALFRRNSNAGSANYGITISGYLVDM
jgi:hypothetical protein